MSPTEKRKELERRCGVARDALQELSFVVARAPMWMKLCAEDTHKGKQISLETLNSKAETIKSKAALALITLGDVHALAAEISTDRKQEANAA